MAAYANIKCSPIQGTQGDLDGHPPFNAQDTLTGRVEGLGKIVEEIRLSLSNTLGVLTGCGESTKDDGIPPAGRPCLEAAVAELAARARACAGMAAEIRGRIGD